MNKKKTGTFSIKNCVKINGLIVQNATWIAFSFQAAYMIVDEMHEEHPELLKDQYWEEVVPKDLPYTVAAEQYRRKEPKGSAEHYKVKEADSVYANLIPSKKQSHMSTHSHHTDDYADYESVDTPIMNRRKSWFVRQISKMGSFRSSSSALFAKNNCNNSVYSSPEIGSVPPPTHPESHPNRKLSLYEIFVGRKSARAKLKHLHKQRK
jgi:bestrophin, other